MTRCTTYLTLAACVMAVPGAVAQQPGQGMHNQPPPTGIIRGPRPPVEPPNPTPPAPAPSPYPIVPLYNPYPAYSYAATSYGGQYAGYGYDGSGGEGGYGMGGGAAASAGASSGGGSARGLGVILKASGVPNQNGHVTWPVGFRLLRADSRMQQLEGQLQLAVEQVTAGGVNPQLLDEIRLNVAALGRLLLADRLWMPVVVYADAGRFFQQLERTPRILAASAPVGRPEASAR